MADRPIIFSGPMVRAKLDGRKTQTRRLATSPLRACRPGDRLWVRESWKPHSLYAHMKPREMPETGAFYAADDRYAPSNTPWVPSIHMPRWASRLTLLVSDVRVQRLQQITDADAVAEGIVQRDDGTWWCPGVEHPCRDFPWLSRPTPREMFAALWDVLHGSGAWLTDPEVVALTFAVRRANVDALPSAPVAGEDGR